MDLIDIAQVGPAWFVFRVRDGAPQKLPGVHASKRAALKAGRIAAAEAGLSLYLHGKRIKL